MAQWSLSSALLLILMLVPLAAAGEEQMEDKNPWVPAPTDAAPAASPSLRGSPAPAPPPTTPEVDAGALAAVPSPEAASPLASEVAEEAQATLQAAAAYCAGHSAYGSREDCALDGHCQVVDSPPRAGGGSSAKGEAAWLCAAIGASDEDKSGLLDAMAWEEEIPWLAENESWVTNASLDMDWGNMDLAAMSSSSLQSGPVMTLYHTTAVKWAHAIVREGFRPGHGGWCGGAVYFIDQPYLPRSKFAPGVTEAGAILEAKVRMGRMATNFNRHCKGYGGTGKWAAQRSGFDSIRFNPGDGNEFIIWHPSQVVSVRIWKILQH